MAIMDQFDSGSILALTESKSIIFGVDGRDSLWPFQL